MKKPDFRKETIELAELSQGFTESLCLIRAEVSRLHVSLLPLFSSFYRFLFSIIDYQLFLRGLNNELISSGFIQGFAFLLYIISGKKKQFCKMIRRLSH
jgi:hypothetical protein